MTDYQQRLAHGLNVAIRVETELHYQAKRSDLVEATEELVEAYRLANNALVAVMNAPRKDWRAESSPEQQYWATGYNEGLAAAYRAITAEMADNA